MIDQSSHHLERIANLTSLVVAALFALTIPSGYFLVSYNHNTQLLQEQANIIADKVSEMIYEQPDFWVYQEHRLADMISTSNWKQSPRYYVISDLNKETVIYAGRKPATPTLSVSEVVSNGEENVGLVTVTTSLRPLLETTLVVCIAGILLAWLIHYLLKVLPFAALQRSMSALAASRASLHDEVEAKRAALKTSNELSEKMRHQAMHDSLTGLPNRAYFNEHASATLKANNGNDKLALLMLDLDRFKEINDSLGHLAGDALLKQVAIRLQQIIDQDTFLARLGGDEFAIISRVSDCSDAVKLCSVIDNKLHQHILLDGYHIAVNGSIGIACYPLHGKDLSEIMRRADMAMYQAKAAGELYRIYEASHDKLSPSRLTLTADLRHALDNNQLFLVYQPKVSLSTEHVAGVEALLRWEHPEYGFISPELFISLAEASGMINDLTRMVLRNVLHQLLTWQDRGIKTNIAINISARNLQDDSLVSYIKTLTHEFDIDPAQLTLEITESNIMIDPEKAQRQIASLSRWGIKIAIDDYGTGYSSLAYLSRLAVHELKIDKSFILNLLDNLDDRIIVRSTIEMAHNLGISVIAEGIENLETALMLRDLGCELGQGYYFCYPTEATELESSLIKNQPVDLIKNTRGPHTSTQPAN